MMLPDRHGSDAGAGFTLIEVLVATALMGIILAGVANITAQWLPNWNRGFLRAQRNELVSIALDRLAADFGASEFVTPARSSKLPAFDGTPSGVTLVRSAVGPNSWRGLETVRIAETSDRNGIVMVRSKAPFAPLEADAAWPGQLKFSDPVALLRAPLRLTFAYAGRDGIWTETWRNMPQLPAAVRVTIRDAASERTLSISTTALVHVEVPASCVRAKVKADCIRRPDEAVDASDGDPSQQSRGSQASPERQP
jgi:general secretion pathway protein J